MFYHNICLALDKIDHSKFVGEKMYLEPLTTDACFFLKQIGRELYNLDLFSIISHKGYDIPEGKAIGLRLEKNAKICMEDNINPEFTAKLKKATACFLSSVAFHWENIDWKEPLSRITIFNRHATEVHFPNKFLKRIASLYSNTHYYNIETCSHSHFLIGSCLTGKPDKLYEFIGFLKREAAQIHTSQTIHLLMCARNDREWIDSHQLPKEIIEIIVKLHSISISPCQIGEIIKFDMEY